MMVDTIAFVMDPMDGLKVDVDTSFALMLAAQAKGFRVVHVDPRHVSLDGNEVRLTGHHVQLRDQADDYYDVVEALALDAKQCRAIFIRTDPPFDESYLRVTWLLDFAERAGVRVVNSPAGIRAANEKLYATKYAQLCPETIVTHDIDRVARFLDDHDGIAIAKPLDGHGGFGVVKLVREDSNFRALVDLLSGEGQRPILVQEFVPEAAQGDKRLLFVNGVLRGAIRRVPQGGDHRGNVHVGGAVAACEIDDHDRHIEAVMGAAMRDDGLIFVGLDVIGDKLIEVNVTSPTLVRELRRLGGPDIAAELIDCVAKD